jgi:hypothetical protein
LWLTIISLRLSIPIFTLFAATNIKNWHGRIIGGQLRQPLLCFGGDFQVKCLAWIALVLELKSHLLRHLKGCWLSWLLKYWFRFFFLSGIWRKHRLPF